MSSPIDKAFHAAGTWTKRRGIRLIKKKLGRDKVGVFDGLSITLNSTYPIKDLCYYLVHSLGSIVLWSLAPDSVQQMFDELRAAKKSKASDPERLEAAISRFQAFETDSSSFAVQLLRDLGTPDLIPDYTNLMRADLAALTVFHREGKAPVWQSFLAAWNDDVAHGRIKVRPFPRRSIPDFAPVLIERQEVLQKQAD